MIVHRRGDLWRHRADAVVVPVNCAGAWGAGLAAQARARFPAQAAEHCALARAGRIRPGALTVWRTAPAVPAWLIALPTKRHWRDRAREDDVRAGLRALARELRTLDARSVAVAAPGAGLGGLARNTVRDACLEALAGLDPLEVRLYGLAV